jgi:6-phosphogluconolactonase
MSETSRELDYGERGRVLLLDDAEALAIEAAERLIKAATEAVERSNQAIVALSGGSTPKRMGDLLAGSGFRERMPWGRTHFFWGDERWVPLSSPESNAGEAKRAFLDAMPVPADHVHPFATEGVTPEESAAAYERLVREIVPGDPIPRFDLVLLGMGDDGHTASLFPGTDAIHERERLVVAHHVPKLNATRLTMTPPLLNAARGVIFLVAGAGKAARLAEVLEGPVDVGRLPSQVIRPAGELIWLVDRAAAAGLSRMAP